MTRSRGVGAFLVLLMAVLGAYGGLAAVTLSELGGPSVLHVPNQLTEAVKSVALNGGQQSAVGPGPIEPNLPPGVATAQAPVPILLPSSVPVTQPSGGGLVATGGGGGGGAGGAGGSGGGGSLGGGGGTGGGGGGSGGGGNGGGGGGGGGEHGHACRSHGDQAAGDGRCRRCVRDGDGDRDVRCTPHHRRDRDRDRRCDARDGGASTNPSTNERDECKPHRPRDVHRGREPHHRRQHDGGDHPHRGHHHHRTAGGGGDRPHRDRHHHHGSCKHGHDGPPTSQRHDGGHSGHRRQHGDAEHHPAKHGHRAAAHRGSAGQTSHGGSGTRAHGGTHHGDRSAGTRHAGQQRFTAGSAA